MATPTHLRISELDQSTKYMSTTIQISYGKKLGLPNFSSHSLLVTVSTELRSLRGLPGETARLYRVLQDSVDKEMQQTGFLPDPTYGMIADGVKPVNGARRHPTTSKRPSKPAQGWQCSDKQKNFILKLAAESEITERELDATAERLFASPAHALDRKQASRFIEELLAFAGRQTKNGSGKASSAKSTVTS
jgi:hypothetical protein